VRHIPVTGQVYNAIITTKHIRRKNMSLLITFFKKFVLTTLILVIGLAVLPSTGVSAAGLQDETTPPANQPANYARLEHIWVRAQTAYQRQGDRLAKADEFIARVQSLIDRANQKGWDTSAVQAALNAVATVIPAVQAAHDPGAAIIASHSGFDANGKVTDRAAAVETVKALGQVLKDTRSAMNGTGRALREAIKAFRDAHRPAQAPAVP
jgi:hypothetical protein